VRGEQRPLPLPINPSLPSSGEGSLEYTT
jgi:hypothetical protein